VFDLLRWMAADNDSPIRYGHLAMILRWGQGVYAARWNLSGMLTKVSEHCEEQGWPDLSAFVVGVEGQPGKGWPGWAKGLDPEAVRKEAHEHFRKEVFGK
jgi:hypothetical protein